MQSLDQPITMRFTDMTQPNPTNPNGTVAVLNTCLPGPVKAAQDLGALGALVTRSIFCMFNNKQAAISKIKLF